MDVEVDHVVGVIVGTFVGWGADASNTVGEFVARRDVAFHCKAAKVGGRINGDDGVLAVDILKNLQEVMEKWFDGIVCNLFGGTIDVNAEESVIQCTHWRIQGEGAGCGEHLGSWRGQWRCSIRRRAIGSCSDHRRDQKVGERRN